MDGTQQGLLARIAQDKAHAQATLHALAQRTQPATLLLRGVQAFHGAQRDATDSGKSRSWTGMAAQALGTAGVALATKVLDGGARATQETAPSVLTGTHMESVARWEDEGGPSSPEPETGQPGWLHKAIDAHLQAAAIRARLDTAASEGTLPRSTLRREGAALDRALAHATRTILEDGLGEHDGDRAEATIAARAHVLDNTLIEMGYAPAAPTDRMPWALGGVALGVGIAAAWWLRPSAVERGALGAVLTAVLRAAGDVALDRFQNGPVHNQRTRT